MRGRLMGPEVFWSCCWPETSCSRSADGCSRVWAASKRCKYRQRLSSFFISPLLSCSLKWRHVSEPRLHSYIHTVLNINAQTPELRHWKCAPGIAHIGYFRNKFSRKIACSQQKLWSSGLIKMLSARSFSKKLTGIDIGNKDANTMHILKPGG